MDWFTNCQDCCAQEGEGKNNKQFDFGTSADLNIGNKTQNNQSIITQTEDRNRIRPLSESAERKWVSLTAYQPIDTVTKTVEIPVIKVVEKYVPKVVTREKLVEVPKYIPEYVEKVVEVPEIHWVDKVVEVPQIQWVPKYVPKVEIKYNKVERNVVEVKWVERVVEVPQIRELIRYDDGGLVEVRPGTGYGTGIPPQPLIREEEEEEEKLEEGDNLASAGAIETSLMSVCNELIRFERASYIQAVNMESDREGEIKQVLDGDGSNDLVYSNMSASSETYQKRQISNESYSYGHTSVEHGRVEQVFMPKVVQTVEIQKQIPVNVDVPVPYMVPKPVVVPVQVPVIKFRDHFHPVPVRRRVIPRIRWTNEIYEVECVKEKPYLVVEDVIKPVACDVEIKVAEFIDKAQPINPTELSQADIHAMWMRCNADLAEKKKELYGDDYPSVKHPPGTVFGEPGQQYTEHSMEGGASMEASAAQAPDQPAIDPVDLHPGHPLNLTYMQNQWLKTDTTKTHTQYSPEWFEAHQKGLYNVQMQRPTQLQLNPQQAAQLTRDDQGFPQPPWNAPQDIQHPDAPQDASQEPRRDSYEQDQQ